jgi:hypothetical protein
MLGLLQAEAVLQQRHGHKGQAAALPCRGRRSAAAKGKEPQGRRQYALRRDVALVALCSWLYYSANRPLPDAEGYRHK